MTRKRYLFIIALFILFAAAVPSSIAVRVKGKVYGTEPIRPEEIEVSLCSSLGFRAGIDKKHCDVRVFYYGNVDVVDVSWLGLRTRIRVPVIPVRGVTAEYLPTVYPGDLFSEAGLECRTTFADGTVKERQPVRIANAPDRFLNIQENISVRTKDGAASVYVSPVAIVSVETDQDGDIYQFDAPDFHSIRFNYADGTSRVVGKDDVYFAGDPDAPLEKLGRQDLVFTYHGLPFRLSLTAKKNTNVTNAVRENREEIKEADYVYISETLFAAVTKHVDRMGTYFLSHVVVNDPSQIVSALSYDTWGGKRERPSSAAARLEMILAVNGSYFSYETNQPRCADVFIKDGKIYSEKYEDEENDIETTTDGQELCLLEDGTLWTPKPGLTAEDLLKKGVTDVWGAGDPLLIQDGKLYPTEHKWVNGKYPRTGIGMVKPCEYYLLTAGSGGYKGGLTFNDVQKIFEELGCSYARTLDGGGSSTLVFNDGSGAKVVNTPAGKAERPVTDFLGFRN